MLSIFLTSAQNGPAINSSLLNSLGSNIFLILLTLKNKPDKVAGSGGNLAPERPTKFSGERKAPELP